LPVNGQKLACLDAQKVAIGSTVPDFTLTDQSSRPVHLADFRGRVVALNFVYTRYPLPTFLSASLRRLRAVAEAVCRPGSRAALSDFNPQYDSPEVTGGFAKIWRADLARWHFLTGGLEECATRGRAVGIISWPEEVCLPTHPRPPLSRATGGW